MSVSTLTCLQQLSYGIWSIYSLLGRLHWVFAVAIQCIRKLTITKVTIYCVSFIEWHCEYSIVNFVMSSSSSKWTNDNYTFILHLQKWANLDTPHCTSWANCWSIMTQLWDWWVSPLDDELEQHLSCKIKLVVLNSVQWDNWDFVKHPSAGHQLTHDCSLKNIIPLWNAAVLFPRSKWIIIDGFDNVNRNNNIYITIWKNSYLYNFNFKGVVKV